MGPGTGAQRLASELAPEEHRRGRRVPWGTAALCAACAACTLHPGLAQRLVLERSALQAGEFWRALSAPLVHGYPALLVVDLVGLAALGAWVELGSRRAWIAVVGIAGLVSSLAVLAFTDLERYVGSSALVDALLVHGALREIVERPRSLLARVSRVVLALLAAKIALESAGAWSPAFGTLPAGVEAVPVAHLAGALTGAALALRPGGRRSS